MYGEGVYGWRLEDRVKPYRAYDLVGWAVGQLGGWAIEAQAQIKWSC